MAPSENDLGPPPIASATDAAAAAAASDSSSATPTVDATVPPDARADARETGTPTTPTATAPEAASAPSMASCTTDDDCQAAIKTNSCILSATCDQTWHVCLLGVCNLGPACSLSSCDLSTETCESPTSMGFAISYFRVDSGGVGGLGPATSIAAAYPFLFLLTTNGVVAFNVFNPTTTVPPMVPLDGVPFIPAVLVASGRRVYFVSQVEGNGPMYRQAIGWIDVPGSPFIGSLQATTAFLQTNQPAFATALVGASGELILVYKAASEPTTTVAPPLTDSMTLSPVPIAMLAQDAGVVAASGDNLVAYRYSTSDSHPVFARVTGATQANGLATPEVNVSAFGPVGNQAAFASSSDGTILWESALVRPDGGTVSTSRLTWLAALADGGFDTSAQVDLETYGNTTTGTVVGPVASLDSQTAVTLTADGQTPDASVVEVLDRSTKSAVTGKRAIISAAPSSLGIAASQGFAYVLAQDDPKNQTSTVYVVATDCSQGGVSTPADAGPDADDGETDAGDAGDSGGSGNSGDGGGDGGGGGTGGTKTTTTFHALN